MILKLGNFTQAQLTQYIRMFMVIYERVSAICREYETLINEGTEVDNKNWGLVNGLRSRLNDYRMALRRDLDHWGIPIAEYRPLTTEICTTEFELKAMLVQVFKMPENLPRPLSRVLKLRKDKELLIETERMTVGTSWTRQDEMVLQKVLKDNQKHKGLKGAVKTPESIALNQLRAKRKQYEKLPYVSYVMRRGPFKVSEGYRIDKEWRANIKYLYFQLMKKIRHERIKSRLLEPDVHPIVRTEPQFYFYRALSKKAKILTAPKGPLSKANHVGIELEVILKKRPEVLAALLMKNNLQNYVCLQHDGSLRVSNHGDTPQEVTAVMPEKEVITIIPKLCEVLKEAGAYVNKTCGFHVHLDARNRQPKDLYDRLIKASPVLYQTIPFKRKQSRYCVLNELDSTLNTPVSDRGVAPQDRRHMAINPHAYAKHHTIEVRVHTGTTNPTKIINWVKFLIAIADSKINKVFMDPEALMKELDLPPPIRAYVHSRIRKFSIEGLVEEDEYTQMPGDRTIRGESRNCDCEQCRAVTNPRQRRAMSATRPDQPQFTDRPTLIPRAA